MILRFLFAAFVLLPLWLMSQNAPAGFSKKINLVNKTKPIIQQSSSVSENLPFSDISSPSAVLNTNFEDVHQIIIQKTASGHSRQSDTLIIGLVPNDSLIITGTFFHEGPIYVINDGKLVFRNAQATILGDMAIWGETALIYADSSYLFFPQQYFYQRSWIAAGGGTYYIKNSTLDFSGLSHSLAAIDSARIIMNNVYNIGFTTNSAAGNSMFDIHTTNMAGEYIITDRSQLIFTNARTILPWFYIPPSGTATTSFPDGDSIVHFHFSNISPGISGVDYQLDIHNCTDINWGLMPDKSSQVSISNSELRAVGLWFTGSDTLNISGLVNNSHYNVFTANIPDRNLQFINSGVKTWSIYPFQQVVLNITGCILGEIGAMGASQLNIENIFIDGSGGYFFAEDTTFVMAWGANCTSSLRTMDNGIMVYAYGTQSSGDVLAVGNSVLLVIQSQLQHEPVPYDGSCVWMLKIDPPSVFYSDSVLNVQGSAWIDKTQQSYLMDFAWYRFSYQKDGDTSWQILTPKIYQEKRNETLAQWNTHGLSPGIYLFRLEVCDNSPDSNAVEAIKEINLLPSFMELTEYQTSDVIKLYPNPFNRNIFLNNYSHHKAELCVFSISGYKVLHTMLDAGMSCIDTQMLSAGTYFASVICENKVFYFKILKAEL